MRVMIFDFYSADALYWCRKWIREKISRDEKEGIPDFDFYSEPLDGGSRVKGLG